MLEINKLEPPEDLIKLKIKAGEEGLSPNEAYGTLRNPLRKEVLDLLMREQGHLCAYCMRKIPDDRDVPDETIRVTIEHWFPRNPPDGEDRGQGLDYNNFLAVCSGNRGKRHTRKTRDYTCDAKRNSKILTVNPTNPITLSSIKYSEAGEIGSDDSVINEDLTITLNLNCMSDNVRLPSARKEVLDTVQKDIAENSSEDSILEYCKYLLKGFEEETDPKTPYVGIIIWWLRRQVTALEQLQ